MCAVAVPLEQVVPCCTLHLIKKKTLNTPNAGTRWSWAEQRLAQQSSKVIATIHGGHKNAKRKGSIWLEEIKVTRITQESLLFEQSRLVKWDDLKAAQRPLCHHDRCAFRWNTVRLRDDGPQAAVNPAATTRKGVWPRTLLPTKSQSAAGLGL